MHSVDNLLIGKKRPAIVPMGVGHVEQPILRLAGEDGLTNVDDDAGIESRREHLIGPRNRRHLADVVVEVFRINDVIVWRNREHVGDSASAAPIARAKDRLPPVVNFTGRKQTLIGEIVQPGVFGVIEPAVLAANDLWRRRDAESEIPGLAVPAYERGSESEVILKPLVETGGPRERGFPGAGELWKFRTVVLRGLVVRAR